jgi:hypothetical protein
VNVTTLTAKFIKLVGGTGSVPYSPLSLNAGVIIHPEYPSQMLQNAGARKKKARLVGFYRFLGKLNHDEIVFS